MKIFIALKKINNSFGSDILGVYNNSESAEKRCLSEPPRTKFGWSRVDSKSWDNGAGLTLHVEEYTVESSFKQF